LLLQGKEDELLSLNLKLHSHLFYVNEERRRERLKREVRDAAYQHVIFFHVITSEFAKSGLAAHFPLKLHPQNEKFRTSLL
jgi:hypothetical protein